MSKTTFFNILRWIALVPVIFVCIAGGYAMGAFCEEHLYSFFNITLYLHAILPLIFAIVGARFIIPQHKQIATCVAIVVWGMFVWVMSTMTSYSYLDVNGLL